MDPEYFSPPQAGRNEKKIFLLLKNTCILLGFLLLFIGNSHGR